MAMLKYMILNHFNIYFKKYLEFKDFFYLCRLTRRNGRVVERGGLENRFTRKGNGGSNPSLSAVPEAAIR